MIGFSGLSVQELRALGVQLRASLSAARQSSAQTWPSGRTRLTVISDWAAAHQTDPSRMITVVVEISSDGGTNWVTWAGFTSEGTAGRSSRPGYPGLTSPRLSVAAPPPGVLVRTREIPGASQVDQGLIVKADP